jgi:hypothetical protein
MKPTHVVQLVLACVVAGGGAAVPLLVSPMTITAWILLAVAEAAALSKVLSVQSEIAGDRGAPADTANKLDAVAKAASKIVPLACLLLVGIVGCAQAVAAIGPGVIFAGCVWTTYENEAPGVPIGQVIADEIAACGSDAANVVVVLDQHEPAASHAKVAHADKVKP